MGCGAAKNQLVVTDFVSLTDEDAATADPETKHSDSENKVDAFYSTNSLIPAGARRCEFQRLYVSGKRFDDVYTRGEKLGEGAFGFVIQAQHIELGQMRAVKCLKREYMRDTEMLKNEIFALMDLDHPHIVKLMEYFNDKDYIYLVFELCVGPRLIRRIKSSPEGKLTEYQAGNALRHMTKALQGCHSQHRGHYDIKPENFMYTSNDLNCLVMIDLGLSRSFNVTRVNHDQIQGSRPYMAPEFFDGIYGPEGDVWSLGVVLYGMLTGENFLENIDKQELRRETTGRHLIEERLTYSAKAYELTPHAQDLLRGMLVHDRHGRKTVREVLNHAFTVEASQAERLVHQPSASVFQDAQLIRKNLPRIFRDVSAEPTLKRIARLVIAHVCPVCEEERMVFRNLDKPGFGEISLSVLEQDFAHQGLELPDDFEDLFQSIDINRDGYVCYWSFLSATLPLSVLADPALCKFAFGVLDKDADGFITVPDLASFLTRAEDVTEPCKQILSEVSPKLGEVSLAAFVELMSQSPDTPT